MKNTKLNLEKFPKLEMKSATIRKNEDDMVEFLTVVRLRE